MIKHNSTPTTALGKEFKELADLDEHYTVAFIRKHLLSDKQKLWMMNNNVGPEDFLNGRLEGADQDRIYSEFFADWNQKLGYLAFGF